MKRIVFGLALSLVVACLAGSVTARDLDGRYANSHRLNSGSII